MTARVLDTWESRSVDDEYRELLRRERAARVKWDLAGQRQERAIAEQFAAWDEYYTLTKEIQARTHHRRTPLI